MKRNTVIIAFLLLSAILLSSCQPKIYGQVRRKKDRKCGCQIQKPISTEQLYTYNESK